MDRINSSQAGFRDGWILLPILLCSACAHATPGALRPVVDLPATTRDVVRFGSGTGVDEQAAVANVAGGGFIIVYANLADGEVDSTTLRMTRSADGVSIGESSPVSFTAGPEGSPAMVIADGRQWLYFASGGDHGLKLWRVPVSDAGAFAAPQPLPPIAQLDRLVQVPRWVSFADGLGVTFRGPGSIPMWARSGDGVHWDTNVSLADVPVAYPRVVPMGASGCFFSYQRPPEGGYMATYTSVSKDCVQWSSAVPVAWPAAPNRPDVHDAYALPRIDGGVDLYYVYPSLKGDGARFAVGFDLYRRAVGPDGTFGTEQLLTTRNDFFPFTPAAHRLANGNVLVTFADIQASGETAVSTATISAFVLPTDAPPPRKRDGGP